MDIIRRARRRHRIRGKVVGTPSRPRLSVHRSNRSLYVQFIDDSAGLTLLGLGAAVGRGGMAQAQALGAAAGEAARQRGITRVVFDRSGYRYHGRVKALAEALRAAGLEF